MVTETLENGFSIPIDTSKEPDFNADFIKSYTPEKIWLIFKKGLKKIFQIFKKGLKMKKIIIKT
jgi:hypothetical protein